MALTTQETTAKGSATTPSGWRQEWMGRWLVAVAIIHTLFAVVVFGDIYSAIIKRGVINTVGDDPLIGAPVWFLLFGAVLALVGVGLAALERAKLPIPAALGWGLLALCSVGVLLMPASGFWLAFPPALGMLRRRRQPA